MGFLKVQTGVSIPANESSDHFEGERSFTRIHSRRTSNTIRDVKWVICASITGATKLAICRYLDSLKRRSDQLELSICSAFKDAVSKN